MRRRDVFAGFALAAARAGAAEPSLYVPKAQRVEDRALLHDFMDEYSFVDVVTTSPTLRITHVPVLLDRSAGAMGTLYGHISRNNVQIQAIEGRDAAVVVFHGPDAYISPGWYAKPSAVPTWNFATVHASGKLSPIEGKEATHNMLGKLIGKFEGRSGSYDFNKLPADYVNGMMNGIMGFSMTIENLEGKFKLGQERSEADRAALLSHLESAKKGRGIGEFTRTFYERLKKAGG
jgi:transcriptional regulator